MIIKGKISGKRYGWKDYYDVGHSSGIGTLFIVSLDKTKILTYFLQKRIGKEMKNNPVVDEQNYLATLLMNSSMILMRYNLKKA